MATNSKSSAVMLTPRKIEELYGISPSQVSRYCTREIDRLPSTLIRGRNGRRGKRLVRVADLETWLFQFSTPNSK